MESKWAKFKRVFPKIAIPVFLAVSFISLISMMLVYRAGKADRMVRIMRYTAGLQLFIALYSVFYLLTFIWIIVLFCRSKRLCQSQTIIFMLASFIFVIMSGYLTKQISKDSWQM
jgi:FlaA1/EpsC-like NDP-sugar epimerase